MTKSRRVAAVACLLLFSFTLSARVIKRKTPPPDAALGPEAQVLWNAYDRATYDSAVYINSHVRKLYPLIADNNGDVLVTTLTGADSTPVNTTFALTDDVWVTAVPEVYNICRAWSGDIDMRLRQLIGLPPDAATDNFLVYQTAASNVFRPSPYDEINTLYPCPVGTDGKIPSDCGNAFPTDTTPAHYQWIATNALELHSVPNGYPWTHLGYTYNWRPNEDRYGASEYIIRSGSTVTLKQKVNPVEYCKMKMQ